MADITLKGNPFHTCGDLPAAGSPAPAFTLVGQDLAEVSLGDHAGKTCVLSIFPSVDTPVCAASIRTFNERASAMEGVVVVNISADLPFAQKRFCAKGRSAEMLTTTTPSMALARSLKVRIEAAQTGVSTLGKMLSTQVLPA